MDMTYTIWGFHGEDSMADEDDVENSFSDDESLGNDNSFCDDEMTTNDVNDEASDDEMQEILEDLYRGTFHDEELNEMTTDEGVSGKADELDKFDRLFHASKRKLYLGYKRHMLKPRIVPLI